MNSAPTVTTPLFRCGQLLYSTCVLEVRVIECVSCHGPFFARLQRHVILPKMHLAPSLTGAYATITSPSATLSATVMGPPNPFCSLIIYSCRVWKGLPQASAEPSCLEEDGFHTVNNQCTREYYYCQGGVVIYQQQCQELDVFDPYSMTCVSPAICFVTYECTQSQQGTCVMPMQCSEEGYYPYPGVCSALYFLCIGGNSFSEFCPPDTVFDPSTSNYQSIETVSCTPGLETTTSAITNPPGLTTYSNTTITPTATTIPATTTTTIQQLQL
ncbi:hypothetical protein OUZ56_001898 [Daphnia magna]|uniref:Chitin-binding type-2 domain-containing protein n=1 Tax=Daphnia magna TaxID=35525 RepID=A0ABR0A416_9CRUS|nr:hypothetical protein OUZ56_001898 [Daphnia magna]